MSDGFEVGEDVGFEWIDGDDGASYGIGHGFGAGAIDLGLGEDHFYFAFLGFLNKGHELFWCGAFAFGFDGFLFEAVCLCEMSQSGVIYEEGLAFVWCEQGFKFVVEGGDLESEGGEIFVVSGFIGRIERYESVVDYTGLLDDVRRRKPDVGIEVVVMTMMVMCIAV